MCKGCIHAEHESGTLMYMPGFLMRRTLPLVLGHPQLFSLCPFLLFPLLPCAFIPPASRAACAKSNFTAGSAPRVCFLCLRGACQRRLRPCSEVEAGGGESRGGGEGNRSRLLLSKPLFV